ncbi:hypothetical protein D3C76_183280 [compost metagenome]
MTVPAVFSLLICVPILLQGSGNDRVTQVEDCTPGDPIGRKSGLNQPFQSYGAWDSILEYIPDQETAMHRNQPGHIRIVLVDDQEIIRQRLAYIINSQKDMSVQLFVFLTFSLRLWVSYHQSI